ncbi:MAG: hypothetical protein WA416_11870 [Candidatus Sulfotelmatobacter sp.]
MQPLMLIDNPRLDGITVAKSLLRSKPLNERNRLFTTISLPPGTTLVAWSLKMKPALAFVFHLIIAILAIPMLALFSAVTVYSVVRHIAYSSSTAQQFCSDHLFLFVFVTGLWLAYLVSDTFTGKSAAWVWIPALLVFALRVVMWRSEGSVLFHSSVVEHFFTADCQIQTWRDPDFASRCADKLFLMQVVIGAFGYSAGAVIQRIVAVKRRSGAVS